MGNCISGWMREGAESLPYKIVHGKTIVGATIARPRNVEDAIPYIDCGLRDVVNPSTASGPPPFRQGRQSSQQDCANRWMREGAETLPYKIVHGKTIVGASIARPRNVEDTIPYIDCGLRDVVNPSTASGPPPFRQGRQSSQQDCANGVEILRLCLRMTE